MKLTKEQRLEYEELYRTLAIRPDKIGEVNRRIDRIMDCQASYFAVSAQSGVPWHWIAAVHSLEADCAFDVHLHNGSDPLTGPTIHVPAGRPAGFGPFTWLESALDTLAYKGLSDKSDWSLAGALYQLERYNGFGYRSRKIWSPYLWSFSQHYRRGKFVSDGPNGWNPTAISRQIGGAVLWERMEEAGIIRWPA